MLVTTKEAIELAQLVDEYYKNQIAQLIKEEIRLSDVQDMSVREQIPYSVSALAFYLIARLNASLADEQPAIIDPTWGKYQIKALECKKSASGNITWQAELAPSTPRKFYIRQANKHLFTEAGYANLDKMQPGDFIACDLTVYTLPDGDSFLKPMHVVSGGTLGVLAPFVDPFATADTPPVETGLAPSAAAVAVTSLPASGEGLGVGLASPIPASGEGLPSKPKTPARQIEIIRRAQALLAHGTDLLVGDIETTGTQSDDEPVSIAFVYHDETVALDTYVRPTHPEYLLRKGKGGKCASDINGITPEQAETFPPREEVAQKVRALLHQRTLVFYNVDFDEPMLTRLVGDSSILSRVGSCLMLMYAQYRGEQGFIKGDYRWFKLSEACQHMNIPTADLHHAKGDAILALRLLKALAAVEIVE